MQELYCACQRLCKGVQCYASPLLFQTLLQAVVSAASYSPSPVPQLSSETPELYTGVFLPKPTHKLDKFTPLQISCSIQQVLHHSAPSISDTFS